ncbi:MAG: alpha/beta hydrolase [Lachnospiraceae bacterium]|nr:alpha/beta hydrolase [Lachnospiraceae bacterium]
MKVIEYGKENEKVVILLHGGGLSWWSYKEVAECLKDDYHVVLPILDGHADSDGDFTSIEANASEIISYIDEKFGGSVTMIGGLSLGAQISVEILAQRADICQTALLESALILPMKMTHRLVAPMMDMSYGLIKKEWFAKLQFASLKMKPELYDEYYRDTCKITKENMIAFLKANSAYTAKDSISETKARVYICVGQKEQGNMIRSAKKLHELITGSSFEILQKRYHGEYSINHAEGYATKVRELIEGSCS